MANILLNEYGWKDVQIAINGRNIAGALGIKFSEKMERELLYGAGNEPLAIQGGNLSYEGELKIHQSELEKLLATGGNLGVATLTGITITSSMVKLGKITTRTFVGVAFTEIGEEYNQNDKFAEITLPFLFLKVIY